MKRSKWTELWLLVCTEISELDSR